MSSVAMDEAHKAQHKRRMGFMPHLYFAAKPAILAWAVPWQAELRARFASLEALELDPTCFIAENADLFAEPTRPVRVGPGASVASHALVHGPVHLAAHASVNPYAILEGGRVGIAVGEGSRIAARASLYAFDHGIAPEREIRLQRVRSVGIVIGSDVWVGTNASITDGVHIGDHAVVGAGAVVTRNVPAYAVVGGAPARVLFDRRDPR